MKRREFEYRDALFPEDSDESYAYSMKNQHTNYIDAPKRDIPFGDVYRNCLRCYQHEYVMSVLETDCDKIGTVLQVFAAFRKHKEWAVIDRCNGVPFRAIEIPEDRMYEYLFYGLGVPISTYEFPATIEYIDTAIQQLLPILRYFMDRNIACILQKYSIRNSIFVPGIPKKYWHVSRMYFMRFGGY